MNLLFNVKKEEEKKGMRRKKHKFISIYTQNREHWNKSLIKKGEEQRREGKKNVEIHHNQCTYIGSENTKIEKRWKWRE